MKRRIKSLFLALAVLISSIPVTMSAVANDTLPTYNAYNEYSTSSNPNGVWSYQYRLTTAPDTYVDMTANDTLWGDGTTGIIQKDTDKLRVYPANPTTDAVLTFIAPYTGTVNISMTNGRANAPAANSVRFYTLHNGTKLENYSIEELLYSNNSFFTGTCTLEVNAGDTIRFVIGVNGWNGGQNTYFNPLVAYTEIQETEELPTYNAYQNYSNTNNPSGAWSYQYLNNGVYTNMTYNADSGLWSGGSATIQAITNGGPALNKSLIAMRAENAENKPVLTFTAEYDGMISVAMESGGVYAPYANQNEVAFAFHHNSTEIIGNTDIYYGTNGVFATAVQLEVKAGDKLYFSACRTGWTSNPTIHINPQISYTEIYETEVMPKYNALSDFDLTSSNPNGVWSYEYRLTTAPDDYKSMLATSSSWGDGTTGTIVKDTDKLKVYPVNPTTDAVLTFTAPYTGTVNISMTNGKAHAPAANSVRFYTLHNGTKLEDYSIDALLYSNNSFFTGTCTLEVNAGDTIRFVIGVNGWNGNQQTYFNPLIEYTEYSDELLAIQVKALNKIVVDKGTEAVNIGLPTTVDVLFAGGIEEQVEVDWDTSAYRAEIGKYVLSGVLDLVNNPNNLVATIEVQVNAKGAVFETYTIWEPGEVQNVNAYHQFSLFTTSKGTLLATAEARDGFSDAGTHHIALKRSTDGGKTWGETIIIANGWNEFGDNVEHCFVNGVLLSDTENVNEDGEKEEKIFCFFSIMESGNNRMYYKTSTDDGLTWPSIVEITELFKDDPCGRERQQATPGQGIQIQNGPHKGRLILPTNCAHDNHTSYAHEIQQYGIAVIYSDDRGETWKLGCYSEASGICEPSMVELADGTLVLNCRNSAIGTTSENYRYRMISTDGGTTWSKEEPWKSIGTFYGCHSDLYTDIQDGYTRMLFSSIESGNAVRNNLQVRLSYDDGATWSFHKEIWRDETITGGNGDGNNDILNAGPGSSGITMISDGTYGVLHGTRMINTRVEIIVFNLAWLTDGKSDEQILKELKPLKNSFDAYDDFSDINNPNLPWKYQHRVLENGVYKYYDMVRINENQWGYNAASITKTQGDKVISSTCDILELKAYNTTEQAVLTFVAPYDGEIYIQMENHAVFAPMNSVQAASFSLLHNEKEIVPKTRLDFKNNQPASSDGTYTGRFFTGTEVLDVKAGDVIRFVVGCEADGNAATYFNPDITYTRIDMPGANRDINGDRVITENDANEMRKVLVGSSENDFYDINEDTACDVKDLVSEKKYLNKIK